LLEQSLLQSVFVQKLPATRLYRNIGQSICAKMVGGRRPLLRENLATHPVAKRGFSIYFFARSASSSRIWIVRVSQQNVSRATNRSRQLEQLGWTHVLRF